jgi:hypothetical protein
VNVGVSNLAHHVPSQVKVTYAVVLCTFGLSSRFVQRGRHLCATRQAQHRARNNPHSMQQWEHYRLDLAAHSNAEGYHCGHSVRSSE